MLSSQSVDAIDVRAGILFSPENMPSFSRERPGFRRIHERFQEVLAEFLGGATPLALERRDITHFQLAELPIHDRNANIDRQFRGLVGFLHGNERGFEIKARVTSRPEDFDHVHLDEYDVLDGVRHWSENVGLAMWLAKPGAARRLGSDVHVANTYGTARGNCHGMPPLEERNPGAWPTVRELPLAAVWTWLQKLPSLRSNFAADPVGRAVHAIGHALYSHTFVEELVWLMVGLESLFTSGESALVQQVRERSQAFLGLSRSGAKDISEMYRIRSKFLHGKLDFPGPHFTDDGGNKFRHWTTEMLQALTTGRAMLLGSLQELILRGWYNLTFEVSVQSPLEAVLGDGHGPHDRDPTSNPPIERTETANSAAPAAHPT